MLFPPLRKEGCSNLLSELALRYRFTQAQIESAIKIARTMRHDGHALRHIEKACKIVMRDGGNSATVNADFENATLDRLILPEDQKGKFNRIVSSARAYNDIMNGWGFRRHLSTGKGLIALFDGPPGTGKTFAAEVLAHILGMGLERVNMGDLVSKYVGETGGNIVKLFERLKGMRDVLLLDEADALLSKRVAKHERSTDRYANMEIIILLQEIDRFEGIVILTTNMEHGLDNALERRIQFRISFKNPKPEERAKLWMSLIPAEAPKADDINYQWIGEHFEMSGGQIKNAILNAAYAAYEQKTPISMHHLVDAATEECVKAGHLVLPFVEKNKK